MKQQKKDYTAEIEAMDQAMQSTEAEVQRVRRELTVCDQQDTAYTESASSLEVRRGDTQSLEHGANKDVAHLRAIQTQLNDINHFKSSNKRSRMQLLASRDELEKRLWLLKRDRATRKQQLEQVDNRFSIIRALQKGDFGKGGDAILDSALGIAYSKHQELA